MKILFVTSEIHPWIKTGGLADVSIALPENLRQQGLDVQVLIPGYRDVLAQLSGTEKVLPLPNGDAFGPLRVLSGASIGSVPVHVLDAPGLYDRTGGPYVDEQGKEWPDSAFRFGALGRVAALLASGPLLGGWQPDILHCNDWQTGLAPAYLAVNERRTVKTLFSIHNLAFQGLFDASLLADLKLPPSSFAMEGLEFHGHISFMKSALHYADHICTVSPTYAEEITTEAYGCGLDALLSYRQDALTGILNGIDVDYWNPASDPLLAQNYDVDQLAAKNKNRQALRDQMQLEHNDEIPVFGMVGRLAEQKGIDFLIAAAKKVCSSKAQLVVLGSGDAEYEKQLLTLAKEMPGQVAIGTGYNEPLAHLIEAGADMFVMPSRYEPCGLNQMYSMRYGTPPIVRRTGGLADSVIDTNEQTVAAGTATGFVFDEPDSEALEICMLRAIDAWHDKELWKKIQRNGMHRDSSWAASALAYKKLYEKLVQS